MLLYGGAGGGPEAGYPTTLWAWDGRSWTVVDRGGPSGREGPLLGFDSRRGVLVLSGVKLLTDTWEWDGFRWTLRDSVASSPGFIRSWGSMSGQVE